MTPTQEIKSLKVDIQRLKASMHVMCDEIVKLELVLDRIRDLARER